MINIRQHIIDLINQYIYTNGNQKITAAQLKEILLEVANAFALEGGGPGPGNGIEAVLDAGSNVGDGYVITNNYGGVLQLSGSLEMDDQILQYMGFDISQPQSEGLFAINNATLSLGNIKREDSSRSFIDVVTAKIPLPGEIVAVTNYKTTGTDAVAKEMTPVDGGGLAAKAAAPESSDGIISLVSSEIGKNVHRIGLNYISSTVTYADGKGPISSMSSRTYQTYDQISHDIVNGPQTSSHYQDAYSMGDSVGDGRLMFYSNLNLENHTWGNNTSGDLVRIENYGLRLMYNRRLILSPSGDAPTAGLVTLSAGSATVVTSAIAPQSVVSLTVQEIGLYTGQIRVSSKEPSSQFTISSSNDKDTCTVFWQIIDLLS